MRGDIMELEGTINKAKLLYMPKEIRNILGEKINLITGGSCVLLAPSEATNKTIMDSLDILKKEMQLKLQNTKNNNKDLSEF